VRERERESERERKRERERDREIHREKWCVWGEEGGGERSRAN